MSLHALVEKWLADADKIGAHVTAPTGLTWDHGACDALRKCADELESGLAGSGEPVGYIAQSSIDALNACRNDEHNGYANIWMRPRDSETIPLFTHPAGAVQVVPASALRELIGAYVRLLETGRDRIRELGGECDPVDVMERGDIDLRKARAALNPGGSRE